MRHHTLNTPNRRTATCVRCGAQIPPLQGLLARTDNGWAADHNGDCPPKPVAIAEPTTRAAEPGIYLDDDGEYFRVTHDGPRLIAQCWDGTDYVYAPGTIHQLRADQRLTATEIALWENLR